MDPKSGQLQNPIGPSPSIRYAIAGCFALAAFCVALIAGRFADNPTATILQRGLFAMLVGFPLGHLIGHICEFTIRHQLFAYLQSRPVPDSDISPDDLLVQMRAEASKTPVDPEAAAETAAETTSAEAA